MHSVTDVIVIVIGAGQSGLAAARALQAHGIYPVVLEAGREPAGSWPHYYDSLTLFSPAGYSSLPGLALPGNPAAARTATRSSPTCAATLPSAPTSAPARR
jgi:cation diffusion facilitator CzcD-associated flavoprotein CzcO